jgi:hypothetical protein
MLGIIVPTYNRPCRVRSLYLQLKNLDIPVTVVFVDAFGNVNDKMHNGFNVIKVSESNFWGHSVNIGFRFLDDLGLNLNRILLLNDDIHVSNRTVEQLYLRTQENIISSPLILDLYNSSIQIFPGKIWNNWKLDYTSEYIFDTLNVNFYSRDCLSGNCLMLPYSFCRQRSQLINTNYFPHVFGDSALTIDAKRQGLEIGVYHDLLAYDDTSDRVKNNLFKYDNKKSFSTVYNQIFFSKKSGMNLKALFIFKISYSKSRFLGLISFFYILFRANFSIVFKYILKK